MIRLLTVNDLGQFKRIKLETLKLDPISWLSTYDSEIYYSDSVFINRIEYWSNYRGFGYYGYFEDNNLIAYLLISPNLQGNKKHIINMSDFAVTFDKRRKGIGKKLIESIIELVKKIEGVEQIQLYVNSGNTGAIPFYEKLGFKRIATIPDSVKNSNGTYQDEFVYIFKI